eukprot:CAMPEP_0172559834 /NCGR_PEP_ID=MMETSP1067-20121228/85884_1 /TAXON_ID=265564 ORGANISM="Thalassiosira punctigera, Strain Tpunct2005C2" /NCGR_SAMPLE_ID=MMETSP1067 /ASSEMBLY_ACC=CAM_ASM_000444 /LENGTH=74 /DNA_ID=CAMNT_0013349515 /DNA_START=256 /DNA_END=480 /DNA_ORIENTATION=-
MTIFDTMGSMGLSQFVAAKHVWPGGQTSVARPQDREQDSMAVSQVEPHMLFLYESSSTASIIPPSPSSTLVQPV